MSDETIMANFCFVSSPDEIIGTIEKYWNVGASHIELVTHSFPERIELIGKEVLPYFAESERYK